MPKLFFVFLFFLVLVSVSNAIISESEDFSFNFVVKPSFDSESESAKFSGVINPVSGGMDGGWQGFLLVPEVQPVVIGEGPGSGPGYVFYNDSVMRDQLEHIACSDNATFLKRLFSTCRIPDDGVCNDGEYFLIDSDCMISFRSLKGLEFLRQMWFIRVMLALAIFMLFRDSKKYPLIVAGILVLLVYNGAFVPVGTDLGASCTDVGFLLNLGYCTVPSHPVFGWIAAFAVLVLVVNYFRPLRRKVGGKRKINIEA